MTGTRIDWTEAHARLARFRALVDTGVRDATEERTLLERRARELAREATGRAAPASRRDVLVFSRGAERYGFDLGVATEVLKPTALTPLPGTPTVIVGVVLHRGEVVPVVDMLGLLGQPAAAVERARVVVVETGGITLGLLADEVAGAVTLSADAEPLSPREELAEWIRGTTDDMVTLLDLPLLVQDPRIVVDEPE
jgi:purine-binding chemotaxis protein CheW